MEVYVRKCRVKDYRDISVLNKNEMGYDFPEGDTKGQLKRLLNNKAHKIYVATVEGRVVGYIHANNYDLSYSPHMKNIMGIAVSSNFKKKGIGKMIMLEIIKRLKKRGIDWIGLISTPGSEDFYRTIGFEVMPAHSPMLLMPAE